MFARFFIRRPVFAWVISLVILLVGGVAALRLPIAQYPDITPPTVQVTALYPGASAQVVADTVAAPIEQQVNGVERMLYMSSQCTNDGAYNLTITFDLGTDLNMAQVLVQNRVAMAMAQLPQEVQLQGVTTKKKSPSILLAVNLFSPDGRYDDLYLSNYATIQIRDELLRLDGVGDVTYLGQRDYSMRAWLDPRKLAARSLTPGDVLRAVQNQNVQVAAGQLGREPALEGQAIQWTLRTLGRLADPEQFGDIIVKSGTAEAGAPVAPGRSGPGQAAAAVGTTSTPVVRLRDVARIELGAQSYDQTCRLDGRPSVALAVFQLPGSNALDVADRVKAKMRQLRERFPQGLEYAIVYDTTPFIRQSVDEVLHTLRDAVILVAIVVLLFLQDWRAMILPMIDVPVSLVGAFAVMAGMGFSLNNLTLFGMVLAIGIVVDDAIVVLENIERQIAQGFDAETATVRAMDEITGPIIAITLVLSAVFVPCALVPGVTGQFFRQFGLVISAAMIISAVNAMTLTPARAVAIFRKERLDAHGHPRHEALPWWIFGVLGAVAAVVLAERLLGGGAAEPSEAAGASAAAAWGRWLLPALPGALVGGLVGRLVIRPINAALARFFTAFNRLFDRLSDAYGSGVARLARGAVAVVAIYVGLLALTGFTFRAAPKAFIPEQDQGYLLVNVQLPDAASVQRTAEAMDRVTRVALGTPGDPEHRERIPGVAHVLSVAGQSLLLQANASNYGSCFVILDPFDERRSPERYDAAIARTLRARLAREIPEADIQVFRAPPIQGLGTGGGFKLQVEQHGYVDLELLDQQAAALAREANGDPRLLGVFTMFRADTPQYYLDIDRTKCESLGVPLAEVFRALQVNLGGQYVNLFNRFGRTWQVNLLGEARWRTDPEDIAQLKIRNHLGQMVPMVTLARAEPATGPAMVMRYNMYASAPVIGTAPGASSGQVAELLGSMARRLGIDAEWTEIMYLEQLAGNAALGVLAVGSALVFLVLAAKYESWKLPLAVILVVPMCLLAALGGMWIVALPLDIFVQVGFLVLVGLAAKNAILIVEFAAQLHREGRPLRQATAEAARLRLRPIVMTSFAFILGVVPLVVGSGAGAEMRRSLGTAVFSGMIGVTAFGLVLTPVFFYALMWRPRRAQQDSATAPGTTPPPPPPAPPPATSAVLPPEIPLDSRAVEPDVGVI